MRRVDTGIEPDGFHENVRRPGEAWLGERDRAPEPRAWDHVSFWQWALPFLAGRQGFLCGWTAAPVIIRSERP